MQTQSIRKVCEMLDKAIEFIAKEIKEKEHRLQGLKERLGKLKDHPDTDQGQIQEIRNEIEYLEANLEKDRAQLMGFQEEFSAACG